MASVAAFGLTPGPRVSSLLCVGAAGTGGVLSQMPQRDSAANRISRHIPQRPRHFLLRTATFGAQNSWIWKGGTQFWVIHMPGSSLETQTP